MSNRISISRRQPSGQNALVVQRASDQNKLYNAIEPLSGLKGIGFRVDGNSYFLTQNNEKEFWIRITDVDETGEYYKYSWEWIDFLPDGSPRAPAGLPYGSVTNLPAYEANNTLIPIDSIVRAYWTEDNYIEFFAGTVQGQSVFLDIVTDVCPIIVDEGEPTQYVSDIIVEYQTIRLFNAETFGDPECIENPAGCCDEPNVCLCDVCDYVAHAVEVVAAGFVNDYADYNGTWELFYLGQDFQENCTWSITDGDIVVRYTIYGDPDSPNYESSSLTFSNLSDPTLTVTYLSSAPVVPDCCAAETMDLDGAETPGDAPSTLTVTPDCESTPCPTSDCCPGYRDMPQTLWVTLSDFLSCPSLAYSLVIFPITWDAEREKWVGNAFLADSLSIFSGLGGNNQAQIFFELWCIGGTTLFYKFYNYLYANGVSNPDSIGASGPLLLDNCNPILGDAVTGSLFHDPNTDFPNAICTVTISEEEPTDDDTTNCDWCGTDPTQFTIVETGFTGSYTDYNGTWVLTGPTITTALYTTGTAQRCVWTVTSGGITVSLTLFNGSLSPIITFSGAAGGTVVYINYSWFIVDLDEIGALNCCDYIGSLWERFTATGNAPTYLFNVEVTC